MPCFHLKQLLHRALAQGQGKQGLCEGHSSPLGLFKLSKPWLQILSPGKPLNTSPMSSFQNLPFYLIDVSLDWRVEPRQWLTNRVVQWCRQGARNQALANQETWLRVGATSRDIYPASKPQSWPSQLSGHKTSAPWAVLVLSLIVYISRLSWTVKYDSWRFEWSVWPSGTRHLGL